MKVLALVDRDTRKCRTMVIDDVKAETLMPLVIANVAREARIMTDEHSGYRDVKRWFAGHGTTSHGRGEYRRHQARRHRTRELKWPRRRAR